MSTPISVIAYIGLGSNLVEPVEQINAARQSIQALQQSNELKFSSLYSSPPMGPQDQPDYVNAVMSISTSHSALELLRALQGIENHQGRERKQRWGARTLDLDILLYGDKCIDITDLIVPHIGIKERAFVLYPLQEIAADLNIPLLGEVSDLVANCPLAGLKKLP